jgi:hypothetical protein
MADSGKGAFLRPYSVSNEEYANRWDAIFGRDLQEQALDEMVRISEELGLYDLNLDGVNGSTAVSKTVSEGSNPSRDAK